jgi:hypothetical protein
VYLEIKIDSARIAQRKQNVHIPQVTKLKDRNSILEEKYTKIKQLMNNL